MTHDQMLDIAKAAGIDVGDRWLSCTQEEFFLAARLLIQAERDRCLAVASIKGMTAEDIRRAISDDQG